jgi:hypothetical protein
LEVGKNILEVTVERRLRRLGHVKSTPGNKTATENFRIGTRGNAKKERPKERWIGGVRRSMTNHELAEEDTKDRDRWRNLDLGEGNPL